MTERPVRTRGDTGVALALLLFSLALYLLTMGATATVPTETSSTRSRVPSRSTRLTSRSTAEGQLLAMGREHPHPLPAPDFVRQPDRAARSPARRGRLRGTPVLRHDVPGDRARHIVLGSRSASFADHPGGQCFRTRDAGAGPLLPLRLLRDPTGQSGRGGHRGGTGWHQGEAPASAGVDTAEWAATQRRVAAEMRHQAAHIVATGLATRTRTSTGRSCTSQSHAGHGGLRDLPRPAWQHHVRAVASAGPSGFTQLEHGGAHWSQRQNQDYFLRLI